MAKVSYAYDVLNHLTIDSQIDYVKTSERDLAVRHVEVIMQHTHDSTKDLYIFDRGYPSLGLLFYLNEKNKDFLIRCSLASCFGKVKNALDLGAQDVILRLNANEASDEQVKELKNRTPFLNRKEAYIDVRIVVVLLETGEKELLITSLIDKHRYRNEIFHNLYGKRWGVEENYKWHKVASASRSPNCISYCVRQGPINFRSFVLE